MFKVGEMILPQYSTIGTYFVLVIDRKLCGHTLNQFIQSFVIYYRKHTLIV